MVIRTLLTFLVLLLINTGCNKKKLSKCMHYISMIEYIICSVCVYVGAKKKDGEILIIGSGGENSNGKVVNNFQHNNISYNILCMFFRF